MPSLGLGPKFLLALLGCAAAPFYVSVPSPIGTTKLEVCGGFVGLQPTVIAIASRAPHLLLEQSVKIQKNRGRASPVNGGCAAPHYVSTSDF